MSIIDPNVASSGWETIATLRGVGVLGTTVSLSKSYSVIQVRFVASGSSAVVYCRLNGDSTAANYLQRGWFNSNGTSVTLYNYTSDPGFYLNYSCDSSYVGVAELTIFNPKPIGSYREGTRFQSYVGGGGNLTLTTAGIRWLNTADDITSLVFAQSVANSGIYYINVVGIAS